MKIALIGATGFVGSAILAEALQRGHHVTALARSADKLTDQENLSVENMDIFNQNQLVEILASQDVVICALNTFQHGLSETEATERQIAGTKAIIRAVKTTGHKRLLMVGGAGSLEVAPNVPLLTINEFPKEYKGMALAMRDVLLLLQREKHLDWSYLSPSAILYSGERTGKFRLGSNQLLTDDKGESKISTQDYAVALLNEMEQPRFNQQRFTVGY